ncbi:DUF2652 domain-containing protein [Nocardioides caldifontis]|uniref:DUF2652 domain-containing protein n=1 Tax=Nocardioides caldifontis TaxID=2588938 RepID=UPI0011E0357F|nr:DUF2652 domain-containing protein [Nocardioides caldifontis]
MSQTRTLLLIADMRGYTDYMRTHRMSLAHAEVNTARLLSSVVDAVPEFDLVEIEGDGAFVAHRADRMDGDSVVALTLQAATQMHRAFHAERQYVARNLCPCKGCNEAEALKLKFVAHVGDVATQTIRKRTKLVGIDVIHVHRLLKNPVTVPEYVLLSEELYRSSASPSRGPVQEVEQELEGVGRARSYVLDVADLQRSAPPLPGPSLRGRVGRTLSVAGTGVPYMLGLRRRRHRVATS